jgi:hypothetical protein
MVAIAGRVDPQDEVCPSHIGEKPGSRMSTGSNRRKHGNESVQQLAFTLWTPSGALARFDHAMA